MGFLGTGIDLAGLVVAPGIERPLQSRLHGKSLALVRLSIRLSIAPCGLVGNLDWESGEPHGHCHPSSFKLYSVAELRYRRIVEYLVSKHSQDLSV